MDPILGLRSRAHDRLPPQNAMSTMNMALLSAIFSVANVFTWSKFDMPSTSAIDGSCRAQQDCSHSLKVLPAAVDGAATLGSVGCSLQRADWYPRCKLILAERGATCSFRHQDVCLCA